MRLFPQLSVEIGVTVALWEYPERLEVPRGARCRGPVKRNSVNYDPD